MQKFSKDQIGSADMRIYINLCLKISRSKTKMMIIDKANNTLQNITKLTNCSVVQFYNYLGTLVLYQKGWVDAVKSPMAMTRSAMDKLKKT